MSSSRTARKSAAQTAYTGEIQGLSSGCAYKSNDPIKMQVEMLFELGRGPQADGDQKTYRYWVAVTERNKDVLAKEYFDLPVTFPQGQDRVYANETLKTITIPRADEKVSGGNFEVLIGFDVTPEMAAFNRDGKRFRVNAGQTQQAQTQPPTRKRRQAMSDLKRSLSEAAAAAFQAAGLSPDFGRVTASDRPDLADFQCNGALAAAKSAKRNPREIAVQVVDILKTDPRLASVEIAGVGFINMRVSSDALSNRANEIAADPRAGAEPLAAPRRVLVDYAGPNVAKPMHVGHLRASIIGESVKRLYRFRGDDVVGDAHFGDWGFQMGLLISAIMEEDAFIGALLERLVEAPRGFSAADEAKVMAEFASRVSLEDLDRLYPAASRARRKTRSSRKRPARPPPNCRTAASATACCGATSSRSAAWPWSASSMPWASISTSGRARATCRT
jgi:hypothetical protein